MSTHHHSVEGLPVVKTRPGPIETKTARRPRNCARVVLTLEVALDPADVPPGHHAVDVLRERLGDRGGKIELPTEEIVSYLDCLDIETDLDLAKVEVNS